LNRTGSLKTELKGMKKQNTRRMQLEMKVHCMMGAKDKPKLNANENMHVMGDSQTL